jgi:hypothetical protein
MHSSDLLSPSGLRKFQACRMTGCGSKRRRTPLTQACGSRAAVTGAGTYWRMATQIRGAAACGANVPLLPTPNMLAKAFSRKRIPSDVSSAIVEVTTMLSSAVAARRRLHSLHRQAMEGNPDTEFSEAEEEALWQEADQIDELLIAYARLVSDCLPAIRNAVKEHTTQATG